MLSPRPKAVSRWLRRETHDHGESFHDDRREAMETVSEPRHDSAFFVTGTHLLSVSHSSLPAHRATTWFQRWISYRNLFPLVPDYSPYRIWAPRRWSRLLPLDWRLPSCKIPVFHPSLSCTIPLMSKILLYLNILRFPYSFIHLFWTLNNLS